ncbi:toprim domain-containing protein [uncultured Limosilactobacillus sp.]|uniref:toprim domain-containing protein n=1 Tax=uncultured Limosilactobacillus sp. TaxID=2837629 RepID=UPI0025DB7A2F|nr:toprim domain-containing protein [uncultured Limosilactobacillus sp.]
MTEVKSNNQDGKIFRQSIQKYLDISGIPYTQDGHYLRLRDHDSLVVDTRITPHKPYETFYWNSQGEGGDLYNFLRVYGPDGNGMDRHEAYKTLTKLRPELAKAPIHRVTIAPYDRNRWRPGYDTGKAKKYLTNVRKLNPKLVDALFQMKIVRELRNGDLFFVWRDQKMKEIGGDVQGTTVDHQKFGKRGTRKMIAKGSPRDFGFHFSVNNAGNTKKLYVFESPIDALSFYNLHPNLSGKCDFLSLNGAGTKVKTIQNFISKYGIPNEVHLAMDTDDAGFKGMLRAKDLLKPAGVGDQGIGWDQMKVLFDQPVSKYKDWNDALKNQDRKLYVEDINQITNRKRQEKGETWFKRIVNEYYGGELGNSKAKTKVQTASPQKFVTQPPRIEKRSPALSR